jgi:hypothetical protein
MAAEGRGHVRIRGGCGNRGPRSCGRCVSCRRGSRLLTWGIGAWLSRLSPHRGTRPRRANRSRRWRCLRTLLFLEIQGRPAERFHVDVEHRTLAALKPELIMLVRSSRRTSRTANLFKKPGARPKRLTASRVQAQWMTEPTLFPRDIIIPNHPNCQWHEGDFQ